MAWADGSLLTPANLNTQDLSGTLDVTGAVTFDSTLTVTGAATFSAAVNVAAAQKLFFDGGTDDYIWQTVADRIDIVTGDSSRVLVGATVQVTTDIELDGALNHDGTTVGFYGTAPIAQQTGVAVTAAGIHAALVALGLITA